MSYTRSPEDRLARVVRIQAAEMVVRDCEKRVLRMIREEGAAHPVAVSLLREADEAFEKARAS